MTFARGHLDVQKRPGSTSADINTDYKQHTTHPVVYTQEQNTLTPAISNRRGGMGEVINRIKDN